MTATLYSTQLNTPLGPMIAIADEKALYLLEFLERRQLQSEIENLQKKIHINLKKGRTYPIDLIEQELDQYFNRSLKKFQTPIILIGTEFQKNVWIELQKIPFGETRSYSDLSAAIKNPLAFRAVAKANSINRLPLLIPCHRVINSDGQLGGYSAGVFRKKWLLDHEYGK